MSPEPQVQLLVRNADASDICLTRDWALHWFNKATQVQQALMSVTWFYIPTMSVVLSLPGNLFWYKCIQPITMSSTCQRARNIPTFYESTVHDCWYFICWEGEGEKNRQKKENERTRERGKDGEKEGRKQKKTREN